MGNQTATTIRLAADEANTAAVGADLALAGVDVAIVERRVSQDLIGSRAGGLHARTLELFDQGGIADRFLAKGQVAQTAAFAGTTLDLNDFPTRHHYGLGLWQTQCSATNGSHECSVTCAAGYYACCKYEGPTCSCVKDL